MTGLVMALVAAFVLHLAWTWLRTARTPVGRSAADTAALARPDDGPEATVCVVVPAWNDADVLPATLDALAAEVGRGPGRTEVIIVAGGADGGYELAEAYARARGRPWRALRQGPRGKNAASNQALEVCEADIVVFLDADTRVRPYWLRALTDPIRAGLADATSGSFRASRSTPVSRIFEMDQLVSQRLQRADVLFGGATIAVHRRVLEAIGGRLPEDVVVGVDWDLSERVARAGLRRLFVPSAQVVTEVPQTWREYRRDEVRWRRAFLAASLREWNEARDGRRGLKLLYLPLMQGVLLAGPVVVPLLAWPFGAVGEGLLLWLAFAVWFVGRHCSRCLLAYRGDGDARWLRLIPAYAWAFCLSSVASWSALLSLRRLDPHFKGRRSVEAP